MLVIVVMLSIEVFSLVLCYMLFAIIILCRYAECHYAECHGAQSVHLMLYGKAPLGHIVNAFST